MVSPQRVFALQSWLFTPGTRLDRLERAEAAGATALILDLEDSISVADKDKARDNACTWLANAPASGPVRAIRINPVDTSHGLDDLRQLLRAKCQPDYIIVPKVEHAGSLAVLRRLYAGQPDKPELIPLIESAPGLVAAESIAQEAGIGALMFGAADMASDLGAEVGWEPLLYARSRIVAAAAIAGIAAIDSPWFDLSDEAGLAEACSRASALGFSGKLAIHPKQIAAINACWTPSPDMIERARRILAENEKGVGLVDGQMVDEAIARQARRILMRANIDREAALPPNATSKRSGVKGPS